MKITRRGVLIGAAALAGTPRLALARGAAPEELAAGPVTRQLAPDGYGETALWGYNGSAPGPEIRLPQGARLRRRLVNGLDQPTSVHWHGIRIDNAMDGVPGLTQPAVAPGASFDYDFTLPDAGTYWYHSHDFSWEQVARGLYGPLVVEEAAPPEVDRDEVLVLDDWRLTDSGALAGDFGNLHDMAHAGRLGNFPTTNARAELSLPVRRHDRLRLRLVNAATARIFELAVKGLEGWVVALDGMPLERPERLGERLVLAPAQRVDLLVDVTAEAGDEAFLVHLTRDGGFAAASFPVAAGPASRRAAPAALPPNPRQAQPALAGARRVPVKMEGGAMGGMTGALLNGRPASMQALVAEGMAWALNGVAGMPETPLVEAARDEVIRLALTNDTAFPHAMHLHGHHFREVLAGDAARATGPMRDTILVQPGESRDIAFAADNPGKWLFHCHMLGHQAAGMKTWLTVA